MAFLTKADFSKSIYTEILNAITRDQDETIDEAVDDAVAEMGGYLSARYDVNEIFAATGSNRNRLMVKLCRDMALYELCKVCENMTDVRAKAYDDAIEKLEGIQRQIINPVDLPLIETAENGQNYVKSGGNKKRSNNY